MVQERAEEIVAVFFKGIKGRDWRAAEALLLRRDGISRSAMVLVGSGLGHPTRRSCS